MYTTAQCIRSIHPEIYNEDYTESARQTYLVEDSGDGSRCPVSKARRMGISLLLRRYPSFSYFPASSDRSYQVHLKQGTVDPCPWNFSLCCKSKRDTFSRRKRSPKTDSLCLDG